MRPLVVRRFPFFCSLLLLSVVHARALRAQDDQAAGLFTEARQLPLVAQSTTVRLDGGDAVLEIDQVFANDGEAVAQADYRLHLPSDATVDGFGFWRDGRYLAAKLAEREEAKARHAAAAAEGRATGLLQREGTMHSFSVYPLQPHALQQVAVTLRVPVVTERGRSQVRLPLDALLAGAPLSSTVLALLHSDAPLRGFGVDGASFVVRRRTPHDVELVLAADEPVELWWSAAGPPLLAAAEGVALEDGGTAVQLRLQLNDVRALPAAERGVAPRAVVLVVDGSFSMRRRRAALGDLLHRVLDHPALPVTVVAVGDEQTAEIAPGDGDATLRALAAADVGFHAGWSDLVAAAKAHGCDDPSLRCVAVTDPQVDALPVAAERSLPAIFLADADELAQMADTLGPRAMTYQPGVEPRGRLLGFADQLVLPVLRVESVEQEGGTLELHGAEQAQVAQGGMLRLAGATQSTAPLVLHLSLDGKPFVRTVTIDTLDANADGGRSVRRALFAARLADWEAEYRKSNDDELRRRIVEVSLREGIPTSLTALQVDDPAQGAAATATPAPLLRASGLLLLLVAAAVAWRERARPGTRDASGPRMRP